MFEVDKSILLVTTASAVNNNLAVEGLVKNRNTTSVAVLHGGWVNMIPTYNASEIRDKYIPIVPANTRPRKVTSNITQVMWYDIGCENKFVAASSLGLHIFDCEGRTVLFSHPCNTGSKDKAIGKYACGLATIDDKLFVGDSDGNIRVFKVYDGRPGGVLIQEQRGHPNAITDLATSPLDCMVVSADNTGVIIVWMFAERLQRVLTIEGYGVQLWQRFVVAGYGSGHIRLFNSANGLVVVEIGAHSRSITGLDLSQENDRLLSVSEDSFAKVWHLDREGRQVDLIASECIQDCLLVGGRFMNAEGTKFCVSTFDSTEVLCFGAMD